MRPPRFLARLAPATALASLLALAGCGAPDSGLVEVSGTVTADGKPLPRGLIVFEPDPAKGNHGPQGQADIRDGRFDTRLSGKGVAPGPQVVRVTGGDGVNPEPLAPFGKLLFDEYTTRIDIARDQPAIHLDVPAPKHKKP